MHLVMYPQGRLTRSWLLWSRVGRFLLMAVSCVRRIIGILKVRWPNGKNFYADKVWQASSLWLVFQVGSKAVFFVSHFAFKAGRSWSLEDAKLVVQNWREIEE